MFFKECLVQKLLQDSRRTLVTFNYNDQGDVESIVRLGDPLTTFIWEEHLLKKKTVNAWEWDYDYYDHSRLLKTITDLNDIISTFEYDGLLRLSKSTGRNGGLFNTYEYNYTLASGGTKNHIKSYDGALKQWSYSYFDGLGRDLQSLRKQYSPDHRDVVNAGLYDAYGRMYLQYLPYEGGGNGINEKGEYLRTEENEEPDQIVIENSESGNREHIMFNDPVHNAKLLKANFDVYKNGGVGRKFLFFVDDQSLDEMMVDSDITPKNYLSRLIFTGWNSVGRKMDFSVYQLPVFTHNRLKLTGHWKADATIGENDIWWLGALGLEDGKEDRSPFFIFAGENGKAYNWLDSGNWMWGNAIHRMGGTKGQAKNWSRNYNPDDTNADWRAILSGWETSKSSN